MVKLKERRHDRIFHALSDSTRRAILRQLFVGECAVSEFVQPSKMSMPAILKHLKVLEEADLISHEKRGRVRFCRANTGTLEEAESLLRDYRSFWQKSLGSLKNYFIDRRRSSKSSKEPN